MRPQIKGGADHKGRRAKVPAPSGAGATFAPPVQRGGRLSGGYLDHGAKPAAILLIDRLDGLGERLLGEGGIEPGDAAHLLHQAEHRVDVRCLDFSEPAELLH